MSQQAPPAKRPRRRLRLLLLSLGPALLLAGSAYFYLTTGRYISTENAYVKADKIAVSSDIDGRVSLVSVHENQFVTAGQTLFLLDREPYEIAFQSAAAALGIVANDIEAYRAAHRQKLAELKIAEDSLAFAQREFQRQQKLSKGGIVSQAKYDEARHEVQQARQRIAAIREAIGQSLAELGGDPELPSDVHPRYLQALAARDKAMLDLLRTTISAPVAGIVSNLQLQVGEYVEAGKPIFSLVASDRLWITANLKETDLTHVDKGQSAIVRADAYPDHLWQAMVESISPATGAEFSLLPPQNASGNWVKVVQRIPVRLRLEGAAQGPPLIAGMSVQVEIDTGYERPLPGAVRSVLAWIHHSVDRANAVGGLTE